ncbi:hypothetical protein SO802_012721 [Lithocarpus litseifolius]|uniref:HAT C-terminal dimerisation domain-containing protein n=1 Tax=Lithocarpus litseifolius TaxID=425828 RepID=A0AAW2D3L6_9ROSI
MQKLLRSSYQKIESAVMPRESKLQGIHAPGFIRPEALVRYVEGMDFMIQDGFYDTETLRYALEWNGTQKVEVYNLVQLLVMRLAMRFFAGLEDHDRVAKLAKLMATMGTSMTSFPAAKFLGTEFYRSLKAEEEVIKEFQLLIKEKKEAMSRGIEMHDLLSYMIFSTDSSGRFMPEHEVVGKFIGLLSAAFSSPSIATTFLMKYLGEKPDINTHVLNVVKLILGFGYSGRWWLVILRGGWWWWRIMGGVWQLDAVNRATLQHNNQQSTTRAPIQSTSHWASEISLIRSKIGHTRCSAWPRFLLRLDMLLDGTAPQASLLPQAFRGHDESQGLCDNGNFLELLQFSGDHNESINEVLQKTPKNCKLTHHEIQKDIVNTIAHETSKAIIKDLDNGFFSILVYESHDISVKEQMVLILRYVNEKGIIIEWFLGIVHVASTTTLSLKYVIECLLCEHNLSLLKLHGQGYDGDSNMQVNNLVTVVGSSCKRRDALRDAQFAKIKEELENGVRRKFQGVSELAEKLVNTRKHEIYPLVYLLVKLALTFLVATATVERSFSAMKYTKNVLRNRMRDQWMNDCLIVCIERNVACSIDNETIMQ